MNGKVRYGTTVADFIMGLYFSTELTSFMWVFIFIDEDFAQKLLDAAEELYTFAVSNRGIYSDCVAGYT